MPREDAIDWCEPNYEYSIYIAEAFNCLTSLSFIISAYIIWQHFVFLPRKGGSISYVYTMLVIMVGITSFYYHATLSLFGQFMDELYISLMYGIGILSLNPYQIVKLNYSSKKNIYLFILVTIPFISPFIYFYWKKINLHSPIYMFVIGFLCNIYLFYYGNKYKNSITNPHIILKLKEIEKRTVLVNIITIISLVFWSLDRVCSQYWHKYAHGIWHILSALSITIISLQGIKIKKYELTV